MDTNYWHNKWEQNQIAFHEDGANPLLVEHFPALALPQGSRIFLPLCGKTLDIPWLLSEGYHVAGAELSEIAVRQFFHELDEKHAITADGELKHFVADGVDIFQGNIFDLSATQLGQVDAIYDRGALVALPASMRNEYTAHLVRLTAAAPQLLVCYEYDQTTMQVPPFSISSADVHQHYGQAYRITHLATADIPLGLKGNMEVRQNVWLLK